MGNKEEEWEAIVQLENCDIVAITETWWDDLHNWSAAMDGYKLFRRARQGRRGGGVALCVRARVFMGKNQGQGQQGHYHGGSLL